MKLFNISRIFFGLPFGLAGVFHFILTDEYMTIMDATYFIPKTGYLVLFTGLLLIATSISIMFNRFVKISCFVLASLLFIFIATIHVPGLFSADPAGVHIGMINLLKDTSLMSGALMLASIYKGKKNLFDNGR